MTIDRCYCFDVRFDVLKKVAKANGVSTVEALQEHCTFGLQCTLCHAYVRRMLRTGEVVFHHIVTAEDEPRRTLSGPLE